MRRALLLVAMLLMLPEMLLATSPAAKCGTVNNTTCVLSGVGAKQTYIVGITGPLGNPAPIVAPSDTFGLTFNQIRCDTWLDSFGGETMCMYYAHTGLNTGTDTITSSSGASQGAIWAYSWTSNDVDYMNGTGSPVDHTCFATATIGSSANNVNGCTITSSKSNDIFMYYVEYTNAGSCLFQLINTVNNGPSIFNEPIVGGVCRSMMVNVSLTTDNLVIPSGPPQTFLLNYVTTPTGGVIGTQEMTFFSGVTGSSAKRKLPPYYIKFRPRRIWRTVRTMMEGL